MGARHPVRDRAKFAHPDRPVIAFVGDGAFQMNGMNELITVKRYEERLADGPLVFCVFNNQDLNQVTWEQRVLVGDPKYPGHAVDPGLPVREIRRAARLEGDLLRRRRRGRRGVGGGARRRPAGRARGQDRPEVPPLPPHISVEQAKKMAKAMVKGIPSASA